MPASRAQYLFLTQGLGVQQIFCAIGFSMGGQLVHKSVNYYVNQPHNISGKAYHWPVMYPEYVKKLVVAIFPELGQLNFLLCL
jgi:uncharacterized membrane protein YhfC